MKRIIPIMIALTASLQSYSGTGRLKGNLMNSFLLEEKMRNAKLTLPVVKKPDSPLFALRQLKERLTTLHLSGNCRMTLRTAGALTKAQAARGIYSECYPSRISLKIIYRF